MSRLTGTEEGKMFLDGFTLALGISVLFWGSVYLLFSYFAL